MFFIKVIFLSYVILNYCFNDISAQGNFSISDYCRQRRQSAQESCDQKLVCYYGSWSVYRPNDGRFSIENIDPTKCTHLIYAFVGINNSSGIRVLDAYNDLRANYGRGGFSRFVKLKEINPRLRVLVSIGGQNEGSSKFSNAFSSPEARQRFVESAVSFLNTHGFDGLDLDWEYPTQKGGKPEDRENFSELIKLLRTEFDKCAYLLSAFVSPLTSTISKSYDIPALVRNLDFMSLGTYNMHGSWETRTGHNSPLFGAAQEKGTSAEEQNIDSAVQGWTNAGVPRNKLLIGVGLFGRSFTLSTTNCTWPRCPRRSAGVAGPYTADAGFLGYNEICLLIRGSNKTFATFDIEAQAPFLFSGLQWVSYDDEKSIEQKINYVQENRLGGIMAWSVDTDDYKGTCGNGEMPLLTALQKVVSCRFNNASIHTIDPEPLTTEAIKTTPTPRPTMKPTTPRRTPRPTIKPTTPRTTTTQRTTTKPSTTTTTTTTTTELDIILKETQPDDDSSGCILPETPSSGTYKILNTHLKLSPEDSIAPVGTVLQYSCRKNYDATEKHAICQEDNQWSASPVCNKRCRLPRSNTVTFICYDANQYRVECTPFVPSGSVVRFKCKDYHKNTNNYNYAMSCDDGSFDYGAPRCDPDCGLEPADGTSLIIDGLPAKRGTFPWHTAVYELRGETDPRYTQICGGTLVATHLVISAAHCFYSSNLARISKEKTYAVAIGKLSRDWYNTNDESLQMVHKTKVKDILIPNEYRGSSLNHQNDIALLELEEHVTFSNTIHPACLKLNDDEFDLYQTRVGNLGKVAGWGLTGEYAESSNELRFLRVPIISFNDCLKEMEKYGFQQYLSNDKMCAGYLNGSAVCKGDSGGGLVFPDSEVSTGLIRWYLRGVVSVGPRNDAGTSCRKDSYTAYTKIYSFRDWISNHFTVLNV